MPSKKKEVTCIECLNTFLRHTKKDNTNYICGNCSTVKSNKERAKHNLTGTRIYMCWRDMKRRCYNPNYEGFHNYGGRGITVCDSWLTDFASFKEWALENGYNDNLTIERQNTNDNYNPENCSWVTKKENNLNRRYHKLNQQTANEIRLLKASKNLRLKDLAEMYNCSQATISKVINEKCWVET
jgi:hypothetical protein